MKNLLYKEFKIAINPLFYLVLLLSALILIPSWLYFIAMSYIFYIAITNIFQSAKANNDIGLSLAMPIKRRDIVKARIMSILTLELLQIAIAIPFAIINMKLYKANNFFMDPNIAFFGFVFVMYAIFNVLFFPMFYKNGYKIGIPAIVAIVAAFLFSAAMELAVLFVPSIHAAISGSSASMFSFKFLVLIAGIVIFFLSSVWTYKISAKEISKN